MTNKKQHFGSKHMLVCAALIVAVVLIASVAGSGSNFALFLLICPLMMGAMMWMMMGGKRGPDGDR